MIIWLPERVYNHVKDNPDFKAAEAAVAEYIDIKSASFADYARKVLWKDSDLGHKYIETVRGLVPDVMKEELDIILSTDDTDALEEFFSHGTDPENILLANYELINSPKYFYDSVALEGHYLDFYKAHKGVEFSTRINLMAMVYEMRKWIRETDFTKNTKWVVRRLPILVEVWMKRFPVDRDIFVHKYLELCGRLLERLIEQNVANDDILALMDNISVITFKYFNFNLERVRLLRGLFVQSVVNRAPEIGYLSEAYGMMKYAVENPEFAIKALTHHNLCQIENFLEELTWFNVVAPHFLQDAQYLGNEPPIQEIADRTKHFVGAVTSED